MTIEHRALRAAQIRAVTENGEHFIDLQIITPNVVDDYGSVWMEDCFDRSLDERMPTLAWAHDWSEPIGRGISWSRQPGEGPVVRFRLDDFDAVPTARRAFAQVSSGTIDDCSVGFSNTQRRDPTGDEVSRWPGVREIIESADDDEVSLVLRGAVPGAKVVAYRSGQRAVTVPIDAVTELARKVNAGEITEDEAHTALELLSVDDDQGDAEAEGHEDGGDGQGDDDATEAEALDALEAAADAALDGRSRLRRGARR